VGDYSEQVSVERSLATLATRRAHAAGMVDVVVGDQHSIDAVDVHTMCHKSLLGLAAGYPSVYQELGGRPRG
jgi:hypothetical protein